MPSAIESTPGMQVTRMTVNQQPVTLASARSASNGSSLASGPTAFNLDRSIAFVALQNPIAPKGNASFEVEWSFKVPGVEGVRGERMGRFADTLYQVAQWYPRVTVYDDLRGW